jgi:hypothetical protein
MYHIRNTLVPHEETSLNERRMTIPCIVDPDFLCDLMRSRFQTHTHNQNYLYYTTKTIERTEFSQYGIHDMLQITNNDEPSSTLAAPSCQSADERKEGN